MTTDTLLAPPNNIMAMQLLTPKTECTHSFGRTSPRSPLECHLLGPPSTPGSLKKKAAALNCAPPSVHIDDDVEPIDRSERRRQVSFSEHVKCFEIKHLRDHTPDEIAVLWMTLPEYQFIKAVVKSTVMMMMEGVCIPDDDLNYCTRGLECRTRTGSKLRNRNKICARSAVLNEQDLQLEEGFFDPQYIAMVSEEASQGCRDGARERALLDERCVQEYLKDTRSILDALRLT